MSIVVFCNIGTRDVIIAGQEDEKSTPPARPTGQEWLAALDTTADTLRFPILEKALAYTLQQTRGQIDHLLFIGTDQADPHYRHYDTLYYAQIAARLLPARFPGQIARSDFILIGSDPPINPSLYDEAFDLYAHILPPYVTDSVHTCILIPNGGTPACNTALILQGVRLLGERCHIFYQPQQGTPLTLNVGTRVLEVMRENAVIEALARFDFTAAHALLQNGRQPAAFLSPLLHYASSRLHFDFQGAAAHLEKAVAVSQGPTRKKLQAIRADLEKLLAGEPLAYIGELYHNALITWNNGRYVDFLGRLIRFQTAVIQHQIRRTYPDHLPGQEHLVKNLAAQEDVRSLLLHILAAETTPAPPPAPGADNRPLTHLRQQMDAHFDLEELGDLCFDLGIDIENLGGRTRKARIQSLNAYMRRQGQLATLLAALNARRPHVTWTVEPPPSASQTAVLYAALQRIDRLVALRSRSIIGDGYQGVSEEIILDTYASGQEQAVYRPVEDMAIICVALNISTLNPFRDMRQFIIKELHHG